MALQNSLGELCTKTFVLENLDNNQSTIFEGSVELMGDQVDLSTILANHLPQTASKLQIYDSEADCFLTLKPNSQKVNRSLLQPTFILLRYSGKASPHRKGSSREDRSKERRVSEAIELVKEWRALHKTWTGGPKNRKKVSLYEAASMLDVPKKTLDDYYCQLRIAEQHCFDFQSHLNEGVGVLRTFVKSRTEKLGKHPKILRVIEDLSFLSSKDYSTEGQSHSEEQKWMEERQQVKQGSETSGLFSAGAQNNKQIEVLQQDFYRSFEFLLDEPIDPFMNLSRNFSPRFSESDSNDILFY